MEGMAEFGNDLVSLHYWNPGQGFLYTQFPGPRFVRIQT